MCICTSELIYNDWYNIYGHSGKVWCIIEGKLSIEQCLTKILYEQAVKHKSDRDMLCTMCMASIDDSTPESSSCTKYRSHSSES